MLKNRIEKKILRKEQLTLKDIDSIGLYLEKTNKENKNAMLKILNDNLSIKELIRINNEYKNIKELRKVKLEFKRSENDYILLDSDIKSYNITDSMINDYDNIKRFLTDELIDTYKNIILNYDNYKESDNYNFNIKLHRNENENENNDKYIIKVSLESFFNNMTDSDIIKENDITNYNENELISFKISFENYYDNKQLYYKALILFKKYNADNNFYYVLMNRKEFYMTYLGLDSNKYDPIKAYYKNNKYSYYENNIKINKNAKIHSLNNKKVRKEYKTYNTKKYDIYSDIENILLNNENNDLLTFLTDLNINNDLLLLDNDINNSLDNKDKINLINNQIKTINFILENYNVLNSKHFNKIKCLKESLQTLINDLENIKDSYYKKLENENNKNNIYRFNIFKSKLRKGKTIKKHNVIDNYYIKENNIYKLDLIFKENENENNNEN